ncbi:MAG: flavodoxin [Clostridia bacterium]|nr:flavodoxin [Clostridia bacterium]
MKTLIAYFSVEFGNTKALAEKMQAVTGADLFEIVPDAPYTKADINYRNPLSRCNKEFFGKKSIPVSVLPENFSEYDKVLIGFPIWYYAAPLVINDFCKALDFTGKKVALFATSGGSNTGKTIAKLQPYVNEKILDAKLFNSYTEEELKSFVEN